ncbi:MAG: NfeD family protein [Firmicutes bacterium HGW-Firmicutes-16]|nr:MAG: NfeD family protein [Firmicutes bacterium HGW-Firmicutes-16]
MTVVWAVLIVLFLIAEGATAGLTSIWFAAGALTALAAAFLDLPVWLQIVLFIVVSVGTLLMTRPLAKKYVNRKIQPTNADRAIGSVATVTERIDNVAGTGAVTLGGRMWTARSTTGEIVEEGTRTEVTAIEGVKLIVEPQVAVKTEEK